MSKKRLYILLGIFVVIFLFFLSESITPYLFLEDDNAKDLFPFILEGMEQLFSGHFPSINLHQLMGIKILEAGTYAVLYPVTTISYFLAHFILKNDLLMFEIFALIHLILGFIFTFLFLNPKTKNYLVSLLASIAFLFSGYMFGLSRGWYYILPLMIFLPLILFLNDRLSKKGLKNSIWLGIIRGIFFYTGNVQYFVYALLFELVYFLIKNYQNNWENFSSELKKYVFSMIISGIIAFPLAWAQLITAKESPRGNISGIEYLLFRPALPTDVFFGSLIFPLLLPLSNFLFKYSSLHYSGTLFPILFFLGGIFLILRYKKESLKKISPLFWCALFSIILSFGIFGIIYSFGSLIPLIKNFRDPFKFIPFSNFFMISFGAIIFSKILEKKLISKKILAIILILFSVLLIGNIIYNSSEASTNYFGDFPFETEYFKNLNLEDYRFVSVATNTKFDPEISSIYEGRTNFPQAFFMTYNFATYFGLDCLSGADPLKDELTYKKIVLLPKGVSNRNLNLSILEEYNVKYILTFDESLEFHKELENLQILHESPSGMKILELENPRGYVFTQNQKLDYSKYSNGLSFGTNFNNEENVTINLLYKKNYICKINGEEIPFYEDELGRIYISVSEGKNKIECFYYPKDFIFGLIISTIIFLILLILYFFRKKIPDINFKIKKIQKIKLRFVILIILILFSIIIFSNFSSTSNFEKIISQKTGVNVEMESFKVDFLKATLTLKDFYVYDSSHNEKFHSDKIILTLDKKRTFEESIKNKQILFYMKNVSLENVVFSGKITDKNSNEFCKYPFSISYPSNLKNNFQLKSDKILIDDFLLIPINKAFFSFENSFQLIQSEETSDILISGDINFERYLNGNLTIASENQISNEKCFILPLEPESDLYI